MKYYYSLILAFLLSISFNVNANDEWLKKLEPIINVELDEAQARDLLEEWVGIFDEKEVTYLYNMSTENFFCKFETGIRTAEITDITITSGVVNVRMNVNEDAHIYVTFNRKTGKVIHCKATQRN